LKGQTITKLNEKKKLKISIFNPLIVSSLNQRVFILGEKMENKITEELSARIKYFILALSKASGKDKEIIKEIFLSGYNDTKNIQTDKVVKGIYKLAAILPEYNAAILTSDLMMYFLENKEAKNGK
jgi:hypothetical protein